ncbi:DUF1273 domain-containing protein [Alkalihalobacterium alkalinitrilicum]|uniref:DUF1273 domain-containing protein n=1 Tax=Alkalihalobacterium alkalinitrilicum TaxID=427920 RepID=UPI00099520F2|nr:DUF1273 domain-containing protein [Alkalihalobacterium alkalinitrilicum]
MKVCVVTGYKAQELGIFDQKHNGIQYIKKTVEKKLRQLLDEGLEWVLISGQLGVEIWTGEVVAELKKEFPQLRLGVMTPFLQQEKNWSETNQEQYRYVLGLADFVDSISKREYESPAQLRIKNQYLIEKSDGLVILYDEWKEGSPNYYLEPALKRYDRDGYPILYITPDDINSTIQEEMEEF